MLDSPTVLSPTESTQSLNMSPSPQSTTSTKLVSSPPTHFSRNISVVDLNNETSSFLLIMMQEQKQQQQQQNKFKINSPLTNSQVFTMSPYSSKPSSSTSIPISPMISPQSPMSSSPTSNYPTQMFKNSNQIFKIVNIKNSPTLNKPVMSQENLSQQQQQQQQLTNNINKQYPINSNYSTVNDTVNNTALKVANEDFVNGTSISINDSNAALQQSQSITISSQLEQDQLVKLQNQAAAANNNQLSSPSTNVFSSSSVASSTSMTNSTNPNKTNTNNMSGEETEEENEVLEESPEGRWSKRNEPVSQRDVPGIDQAFLAMDNEYGIEVVWNEIILSGGKKLKNKQDENQIDLVFENLINLNHPNIVKFHKHWRDKNKKPPRIIFITEYMSSGSLKQFLRKAKRTNQPIKKQTWKRWCIQLLTALHYLHNCDPPIIHGDLSCDTIFIQHNGLIKIGSIAPDIVNQHVKTCIDKVWWSKNAHFLAPELNDIYNNSELANPSSNSNSIPSHLLQSQQVTSNSTASTTAVDIYAFGMVALEMFNLELGGNGDTHTVTPELIKQSIECLDEKQRDFINCCLQTDPKKRPTAKELLFHPLLFEVPSLRLLAAHQIIQHQNESRETCDADFRRDPDFIIATTNRNFKEASSNESPSPSPTPSAINSVSSSTSNSSNSLSSSTSPTTTPTSNPILNQSANQFVSNKYVDFKYSSLTHFEANKYLEDVKNGIYPLTAYGLNQYSQQQQQQLSKQKLFLSEQQAEAESQAYLSVKNDSGSPNRQSLSPSNTSMSGASTSVANMSNNLSSSSSSSSTSPSQSLTTQVNVQQQQQLIQSENLNMQSTPDLMGDNETHRFQEFESELSNSLIKSQFSMTPTSTPPIQQQLQQQLYINNADTSKILNSSPSISPPPPQMPLNLQSINSNVFIKPNIEQIVQNNNVNSAANGSLSRTQSPITTTTNNINGALLPTLPQQTSPSLQQSNPSISCSSNTTTLSSSNINDKNKLGENSNSNYIDTVERRHAEKMEFFVQYTEKVNSYKLSLNITFDDKTSRFLESQINNNDTANKLTEELIFYGLVSEIDKECLYATLQTALSKRDLIENESNNSYYLSK